MRYLLPLLLLAGCSSSLTESADVKAVRAWHRENHGDGQPIEIVEVKKSGQASQFLVAQYANASDFPLKEEWVPCKASGRCVPIRVRYPKAILPGEFEYLFVIEGGKVKDYHAKYKRK